MKASSLLAEIKSVADEVVLNDDRIRIEAKRGSITAVIHAQLIEQKVHIIRLLQAEQQAHEAGWLSLGSGTFCKRIDTKTELFLFDEKNGWTVWRGTWEPGDSKPFSETTLVEGVSFEVALVRAQQYISWRKDCNIKDKKDTFRRRWGYASDSSIGQD